MELEELKNHYDGEVRGIALIVEEAIEGLKNNEITKEQFDELIEDITQIEKIDELATDLERKIMMQQVFDSVKYIVEGVIL